MTDFGTPEERSVALRVAVACKELNAAISSAHNIGVFVRVADISAAQHESHLTIRCMERRTTILPTSPSEEN